MAQKKPESNQQAALMLNRTLLLTPELDGSDRVEQYKSLLNQLPPPPKVTPAPATTPKTKPKTKK
jgi:hypothetical protein